MYLSTMSNVDCAVAMATEVPMTARAGITRARSPQRHCKRSAERRRHAISSGEGREGLALRTGGLVPQVASMRSDIAASRGEMSSSAVFLLVRKSGFGDSLMHHANSNQQ